MNECVVKGLLKEIEFKNGTVWRTFWCPGCRRGHTIDGSWGFDGDYEHPTFTPSVLSTTRHPTGYSNKNPAPLGYSGPYTEERCHSFVRAGRIEFLSDCTHELAGQTVDLPPWEAEID